MSDAITTVFRIAKNEYNIKDLPWRGAVGIEQVYLWDDGSEVFGTPPLVCWLTRGENQKDLADKIVSALNSDKDWLDERAKRAGCG